MFESAAFRSRLTQVFGQIGPGFLARVFGTENTVYSSTGTETCSFTVLQGRETTVLQYYWCGKKGETTMYLKSHVLKHPIYQKNVAVLPLKAVLIGYQDEKDESSW